MSSKTKEPKLPPVHPASELFDLHEGEKLWQLADDIKQHGQRRPIVMFDGKIVDGRRRYLACQRAGVEPITEEFAGKEADIAPWVWSENYHRRHLGAGERAMSAAKYQDYIAKHPTGETAASVPEKFNVSPSSVNRAKKVNKKGDKTLIDAVAKGKITVADAAKIADKPKAEQKKAVEAVKNGKANTVTKAVKVQPKNGSEIVFDEQKIEDAFGKLMRTLGERWAAYGKKDNCPYYEKARDAMGEVLAAVKKWRQK